MKPAKVYLLSAIGHSAVFNSMFRALHVRAFLSEDEARAAMPEFAAACCDRSKGIDYAVGEALDIKVITLDVA